MEQFIAILILFVVSIFYYSIVEKLYRKYLLKYNSDFVLTKKYIDKSTVNIISILIIGFIFLVYNWFWFGTFLMFIAGTMLVSFQVEIEIHKTNIDKLLENVNQKLKK